MPSLLIIRKFKSRSPFPEPRRSSLPLPAESFPPHLNTAPELAPPHPHQRPASRSHCPPFVLPYVPARAPVSQVWGRGVWRGHGIEGASCEPQMSPRAAHMEPRGPGGLRDREEERGEPGRQGRRPERHRPD